MTDSGESGGRSAPLELLTALSGRFRAFALDVRRAIRERALARTTSRESLRVYRTLEVLRPELTGLQRYQAVVAQQAGLDELGARRVVERAESNFASWPLERPVSFRDVVQYLIVQRWLVIDPEAQGFRSNVGEIVAREIPEEL